MLADSKPDSFVSINVLNPIPAPSPLKFIGNRKFAMGQFAVLSFICSHPTSDASTLSHKPPRSYDFMSTQKFTFSVWPSLQILWTVCMIHFCFGWTFSMWKTSSYCILSLTSPFMCFICLISSSFGFPLLGGFSSMSSSLHFQGLKSYPLVSSHLVPHGILVVEKNRILLLMFCYV